MRCVLFVLLPFALLVLIMVAIGNPVATKHVEKVTSWTTTALNRNGVLRSPHSTYAYAVPMPNIRGAYEEHPIHGLMREARANWTAKVEQQSKSLDEAVREYRRRFGREPPPGFEKWCVEPSLTHFTLKLTPERCAGTAGRASTTCS